MKSLKSFPNSDNLLLISKLVHLLSSNMRNTGKLLTRLF